MQKNPSPRIRAIFKGVIVFIILFGLVGLLVWQIPKPVGTPLPTYGALPTQDTYKQFTMTMIQKVLLYFDLLPRISKSDYDLWLNSRPQTYKVGLWQVGPSSFDDCSAFAGYGKDGSFFSITTKSNGYVLEILDFSKKPKSTVLPDAPWISSDQWLPPLGFTMQSNIGWPFTFSRFPHRLSLTSEQTTALFNTANISLSYGSKTVIFPHDDNNGDVVPSLEGCKEGLDAANKSFGPWLHLNDRNSILEPAPQ